MATSHRRGSLFPRRGYAVSSASSRLANPALGLSVPLELALNSSSVYFWWRDFSLYVLPVIWTAYLYAISVIHGPWPGSDLGALEITSELAVHLNCHMMFRISDDHFGKISGSYVVAGIDPEPLYGLIAAVIGGETACPDRIVLGGQPEFVRLRGRVAYLCTTRASDDDQGVALCGSLEWNEAPVTPRLPGSWQPGVMAECLAPPPRPMLEQVL